MSSNKGQKEQPMKKRTKGTAGEAVDMRAWRRSPHRAGEWSDFIIDNVTKYENHFVGSIRSDEVADLIDTKLNLPPSSSPPPSSPPAAQTPAKKTVAKKEEEEEEDKEYESPAKTAERSPAKAEVLAPPAKRIEAPPRIEPEPEPQPAKTAEPLAKAEPPALPAARLQHRRPREDDDYDDDSSSGYSCSDHGDSDDEDAHQVQEKQDDDEAGFLAVQLALMGISDTLPGIDFSGLLD